VGCAAHRRPARGVRARHAAPTSVLPATISALGKQYFGGRVFVETLSTVAELSALPPE